MVNKKLSINFAICLILGIISSKNCFSQRFNLIDSCVQTAINDFVKDKSFKDKVYRINISLDHTNIIGISIMGSDNKYFANPKDKVGVLPIGFPSKYLEINNKLFCWQQPDLAISSEIVSKLSEYNQIDSTYVDGFNGIIPPYLVDDKKKANHYYFCSKNIKKFKIVTTSIGIGYYKRPRLNCE